MRMRLNQPDNQENVSGNPTSHKSEQVTLVQHRIFSNEALVAAEQTSASDAEQAG